MFPDQLPISPVQDQTIASTCGTKLGLTDNCARASWRIGKEEREEEKGREVKKNQRSEMNCHYSGSFC